MFLRQYDAHRNPFPGLYSGYCSECLIEIGYNIVNVFDAYGYSNKIRGYAGRSLFFIAELLMRRRCRVNNERFGIPDISDKACEF
jgi:hypothetical protein